MVVHPTGSERGRPSTAPFAGEHATGIWTCAGNRPSTVLEHQHRRHRRSLTNNHCNDGHFTQHARDGARRSASARADLEGFNRTDRPIQSFTRTNPAPLLTGRTERSSRDRSLRGKVDTLSASWAGPEMKSRKDVMGGRVGFNHGHESRVDQRRLNTLSTYPFITRLEHSKPNGQVWPRTMPVEDPGDAGGYSHQQKQTMTSSQRVGSWWFDAQRKDMLHGCRKPMDSVWFGSIRRQDDGGHMLGNLRARGADCMDRPENFQGTAVYSNSMCYGR